MWVGSFHPPALHRRSTGTRQPPTQVRLPLCYYENSLGSCVFVTQTPGDQGEAKSYCMRTSGDIDNAAFREQSHRAIVVDLLL